MADKDIKIGIVTTADTSGIDKVIAAEKELTGSTSESRGFGGMLDAGKVNSAADAHKKLADNIDLQAQAVDRAMAKIESYGGKAGGTFVASPVSAAPGGISSLLADAVAMKGSFAAIAAAGMQSYQLLKGSVDQYKAIFAEAKAAGVELPQDLQQQVQALEETLAPIAGPIEKFRKLISDPIGTFSGTTALKESIEAQIVAAENLRKARIKAADEGQDKLSGIYKIELDRLKEQEDTVARIANLRSQLAAASGQAASQEVEIAKLRGGDVAAAEANALAERLQNGLAAVGDKLRLAVAAQNSAEAQYQAAAGQYQRAITDRLNEVNPAEFKKISDGLDAATKLAANANQAVTDQKQIFESSRLNFLRGTEIELNKLEQEYSPQMTAAAKKGFDAVYQKLQEEVAAGPVAAVANIQAATSQITEAANQKGAQINSDISAAANTVSQSGQAIQDAFQTYGQKADEKDAKILSAVNGLTARVEAMMQSFSQLEGRVATLTGQ